MCIKKEIWTFVQISFLFHRKHLVTLNHERPAVSYEIKNAPRGIRIRTYKENVAFATALSARVRKRTLCSLIRKFLDYWYASIGMDRRLVYSVAEWFRYIFEKVE